MILLNSQVKKSLNFLSASSEGLFSVTANKTYKNVRLFVFWDQQNQTNKIPYN